MAKHGKYRIMMVDDDDDVRAILRALLRHHGYETLEATTAEEMLERIDVLQPDLFIMDIRLPGIDGCEAIGVLRGQGFDGPILVFSEYYDLMADRLDVCPHDGFFEKSRGPLGLVGAIARRLADRTGGSGTASPTTV